MQQPNKRPIVSWSGGVDSTAILIDLFSKKIPFETIYVKLPNNDIQQEYELRARKKLLKKLTKLFGNYHIKDHIITFVGMLAPANKISSPQPYVWATSIAFDIDLTKYSEIIFGYIKEDDFWHTKIKFESLLKSAYELLYLGKIIPKISYPLEWVSKAEVISNYYEYDDDVYKLLKFASYCENIKNNSICGECKKCKDMKQLGKHNDS
ncbi:MAG: hypothetical protein KAS32_23760 [Candidatus Peribacteraceae bacterium]|nr:hypothetical protein [Candidatus Peribacteraceae bacterium]